MLHDQVWPVVALTGPESVGKWTLAEHIALAEGGTWASTIREANFTAERAGLLLKSTYRLSAMGARFVIISLDGASEQAQNMLLKVLEEPPEQVRFFLVASQPVLPTVLSRAQCFPFGLLPQDDIVEILMRNGMSERAARQAAPAGAGQVGPAMRGTSQQARAAMLSVLRALATGSLSELQHAMRDWDERKSDTFGGTSVASEAYLMLGEWASEAAVDRWHVFTPDTVPQFNSQHARRIWRQLASAPAARPRLAVEAALAPLCPKP